MALNKDYVLQWISHMNDILWKCCEYLDDLKPEYASDMKSILLYLHVLVSFTSTNTWAVLKHKNMEVLKSGTNQLCANLMGKLFHRGFYLTLKVQRNELFSHMLFSVLCEKFANPLFKSLMVKSQIKKFEFDTFICFLKYPPSCF